MYSKPAGVAHYLKVLDSNDALSNEYFLRKANFYIESKPLATTYATNFTKKKAS